MKNHGMKTRKIGHFAKSSYHTSSEWFGGRSSQQEIMSLQCSKQAQQLFSGQVLLVAQAAGGPWLVRMTVAHHLAHPRYPTKHMVLPQCAAVGYASHSAKKQSLQKCVIAPCVSWNYWYTLVLVTCHAWWDQDLSLPDTMPLGCFFLLILGVFFFLIFILVFKDLR